MWRVKQPVDLEQSVRKLVAQEVERALQSGTRRPRPLSPRQLGMGMDGTGQQADNGANGHQSEGQGTPPPVYVAFTAPGWAGPGGFFPAPPSPHPPVWPPQPAWAVPSYPPPHAWPPPWPYMQPEPVAAAPESGARQDSQQQQHQHQQQGGSGQDYGSLPELMQQLQDAALRATQAADRLEAWSRWTSRPLYAERGQGGGQSGASGDSKTGGQSASGEQSSGAQGSGKSGQAQPSGQQGGRSAGQDKGKGQAAQGKGQPGQGSGQAGRAGQAGQGRSAKQLIQRWRSGAGN